MRPQEATAALLRATGRLAARPWVPADRRVPAGPAANGPLPSGVPPARLACAGRERVLARRSLQEGPGGLRPRPLAVAPQARLGPGAGAALGGDTGGPGDVHVPQP